MALKRLPKALRGRAKEQSDALYSDREILSRINANSAHLC